MLPCIRHSPKIKAILRYKSKNQINLYICSFKTLKNQFYLQSLPSHEIQETLRQNLNFRLHCLHTVSGPKLIDCGRFRVHLHWQGWQPSLYETHSDSEAYFEGKKVRRTRRKIRNFFLKNASGNVCDVPILPFYTDVWDFKLAVEILLGSSLTAVVMYVCNSQLFSPWPQKIGTCLPNVVLKLQGDLKVSIHRENPFMIAVLQVASGNGLI
jgi:hypothetical protein